MFADLNLIKTTPYAIYLPCKIILNNFYENNLKGTITYSNSQTLPVLILNACIPKCL